jgi:D-alanine-D-alanine ligase
MSLAVDPEWWKTLFDEIYLLTDARSVMDDDLTAREINVILSLLPLEPNHRILDLCAGQGRHCLELARRGYQNLTALDYSPVLIAAGLKLAARNGLAVHFTRGDARDAPFPDASFDCVFILGNSLGYSSDPASDLRILAEVRRLLKPRGAAVLDLANGASARQCFTPLSWHEAGESLVVCRMRQLHTDSIAAREMVLCKRRGLIRDRTYMIRLYEPEDIAGLLSAQGFSGVEVHTDFSPHYRSGDYGFMNHRMIAVGRKG